MPNNWRIKLTAWACLGLSWSVGLPAQAITPATHPASSAATAASIPALPLAPQLSAAPSPAQQAFNQVAGLLLNEYGGLAAVDRAALVGEYQRRLNAVCAPTPLSCAEDVAYPVLEAQLTELGDPHSFLQWPDEYQDYLSSALGGQRRQYGVRLAGLGGERRLVTEVVGGSSAEAAGLQRGDVLETLDGQPYRYADLTAAKEQGRAVQLGVRRQTAPNAPTQRLTLTLQAMRSSSAELPTLRWLGGGTGARNTAQANTAAHAEGRVAVLRVPTFLAAGRVASRVHAAVAEAQAGGAAGLIVDLRGNSGGSLSECDLAVSAFVPQFQRLAVTRLGPSLSVVRGGQRWDEVPVGQMGGGKLTASVTSPQLWQGPLAVLVDSHSASCAEFFAYEVQYSGVGVVVGTPTAGLANTATRVFPLGEGAAGLQLTVLHYAKPSGDVLSGDVLSGGKLNGAELSGAATAGGGGAPTPYPTQIQPDLYAGDGEAFLQALARGSDPAIAAATRALGGSHALGRSHP